MPNFSGMVMGHLVGDYLLQSKKMALMKSQPGLQGFLWCLGHSVLYTASICLFCWRFDPLFTTLIFLTHFPMDRWSLGEKWLKMIGGRNFKTEYTEKSQNWEIHLSFACLVYVVVDNTLHLIPMWLIDRHF